VPNLKFGIQALGLYDDVRAAIRSTAMPAARCSEQRSCHSRLSPSFTSTNHSVSFEQPRTRIKSKESNAQGLRGDYPYFRSAMTAQGLAKLDFTAAEARAIDYDNAKRILPKLKTI